MTNYELAKSAVGATRQRRTVNRMTLVPSFFRGALLLAFGVFGLESMATDASAKERPIRVELDYARIVRIPPGAQTLVIGNPLVADVTMLRNSQLMVITGKSFGTTNLIVLDRTGAQVGESIVTVAPAEDKLVVQRGMHRESYSCNPRCAKAVDLADDSQYMSQTIDAVKAHDGAATSTRR
ncbi:pilus assembly protein N-terminal domain-containing protein [Methylocystis sp. WRRC1]|uniref:pilus assembly protein N-terminal domain-containing protein n=1 Tax=unclassified Methylocystis TaxID=2625913 RepID=UPI0001F86820|nr:pilus assembly protein N-terminal domain-containing protein [Methylocystis sp. ATCC 49242]MCC3247215.1 pilus assembly protein N-terminal domain-containing protein [Methylocystis sp. WRRC1]